MRNAPFQMPSRCYVGVHGDVAVKERASAFRRRRVAELLPVVFLGACASPGPPRPPSLNLPEIVPALDAARVGDRVELRWTTPEKTTDGLDVRGPMTAVVCRRAAASPGRSCAAVLRLPTVKGLSEAVDPLPPSLLAAPAAAVEYRLEILNAGGHSAGMSAAAWVASGPAPPALKTLRVEASERGAVLTWQDIGTPDAVELHRVADTAFKSTRHPAHGAKTDDASDVFLRVPPGDGALDRTVRIGERYIYTARRVRTVVVAGHELQVRGDVSAPVALEMRDVFPPRRPTGLEAMAGEHVVDLSWEPNTESDLAGYVVLRREGGSSAQLNPSPVAEPSFEDKTAAPGHTYRYAVVAVDRAGNRSPASEPEEVSIRPYVP